MITLDQTLSDHNKRMITLTELPFPLNKLTPNLMVHSIDNIICVITLSSTHLQLQWKVLIMIALGQMETDKTN